ncbi:MAG: thiamine biosynthesis protein ThiS [Thermoprotei archaeon]|nr:MAG: thiamine biosynthesis protein ThiS [Thermoprotei archaeon]
MAIKVRSLNGKIYTLDQNRVKVKELFKILGLLSEEYIVVKNGRILTEEDEIVDGDEVVLYPVVSGG